MTPVPFDSQNDVLESAPLRDWCGWLLLGGVLLLVVAIRVRTLDVPLERDEGEYAYIASLMLKGCPPYSAAYTMKLPGMPAMYALAFAAMGESTRAVHLVLVAANLVTSCLMYWLARQWYDRLTAALAASVFACWSLMPELQGTSAHGEQFALPFGLAGYSLLVRHVDDASRTSTRKLARVIGAGCLFGVAVLIKQHAAFFVAPAALYLYLAHASNFGSEKKRSEVIKSALWLVVGIGAPLVLLVATVTTLGVFSDFWFWTVTYARHYGLSNSAEAPAWRQFFVAIQDVTSASYLFDGLALVGIATVAWEGRPTRGTVFWLCVLLGGVLAVLPGMRFHNHYFIMMLPAASMFAALGLSALCQFVASGWQLRSNNSLQLVLSCVVIASTLWEHRAPWFLATDRELSRITYGNAVFPDALDLASYVKAHAAPTDRLLVFGSEPEIYFYAGLPAATKYIYTYPLMERQPYAKTMQDDMIRQIEGTRPEFCIVVHEPSSWGSHSEEFFDWWRQYRRAHYDQDFVVEVLSNGQTRRVGGDAGRYYQPQSQVWFAVLRRRNSDH